MTCPGGRQPISRLAATTSRSFRSAMDSELDAARPWVAAAEPSFVTLIDRDHRLSSLYHMVNVPQAVWIDERGRIVRPTETGGAIDIVKDFDPAIGGFPPDVLERAGAAMQTYRDAVCDWAQHGAASRHVFDGAGVRARKSGLTAEMAEAHTRFRLATHLQRAGCLEEAERHFARCRELHPDSINIFRQSTEKIEGGIAAGPAFWEKVVSLGDAPYYAPIDMDGLRD